MRSISYFIVTVLISAPLFLFGQTGCPGCVVNLPAGLPVDTVYLPPIPDGQVGLAYNKDISFRMPKTTTPVAAIDSVTPPGLNINSIEILSVEGLPPGLSWQANQTVFPVSTQTDGCIKICGTPTESDSFVIIVRLKATVLFFNQEAVFPMRMYIAPEVSANAGFSMSNPEGCGSTTVSFTNNNPSNGNAGFSYSWDFGDGTVTTDETPAPHTYSTPGSYIVKYKAVVDTTGFILQSILLKDLNCADNLGLNAPDMYLFITDSAGVKVFESNPPVNNISLPYTVTTNLRLKSGNYVLQVWDEDGGIQGTDDQCGIVTFNLLSNGTVVSNGFEAVLNIIHPITTLLFSDTVVVYPQPALPILTAPIGLKACANFAPLPLYTSYSSDIEWFKNGTAIPFATDSVYLATNSGSYQVEYTSLDGCKVISTPALVELIPLPVVPLFFNNQNLLTLFDTLTLPSNSYTLQWYLAGQAIPSNGYWHCAVESGLYKLVLTDNITGCVNSYELNVVYNPNLDCTTSTQEGEWANFALYPNPVTSSLQIDLGTNAKEDQLLQVFDATGRLVATGIIASGNRLKLLDCTSLANGIYYLNIVNNKGTKTHLFVKK
jgi:PKD repeat protein